jgi:hypothetical protein
VSYTERNPYVSRIADLEEEVEFWRSRAEAAETALRGGSSEPGSWSDRVYPLSLFQTRIMRLLARRPMTSIGLQIALQNDYPKTSDGSIKVHLSTIRGLLPPSIAPVLGKPCRGTHFVHRVPDPKALVFFLETGLTPAQRRAA